MLITWLLRIAHESLTVLKMGSSINCVPQRLVIFLSVIWLSCWMVLVGTTSFGQTQRGKYELQPQQQHDATSTCIVASVVFDGSPPVGSPKECNTPWAAQIRFVHCISQGRMVTTKITNILRNLNTSEFDLHKSWSSEKSETWGMFSIRFSGSKHTGLFIGMLINHIWILLTIHHWQSFAIISHR